MKKKIVEVTLFLPQEKEAQKCDDAKQKIHLTSNL